MARMYSRKRGISGSTKPTKGKQSSWVRYKGKEVEMLIVKLAKEDKTASQIGVILRDVYGIPYVKNVVGKKVTKILEEHKLVSKIPEDLMSLIKRGIALRKHLEKNLRLYYRYSGRSLFIPGCPEGNRLSSGSPAIYRIF